MISTPCYGGFPHTDFLMSLFRLYEYSKYTRKNDIEWCPITGANIYWIRNKAFRQFKESKHHALLMVDNDMVFHERILEILFERDKDIIMPIFTNKVGNMLELQNAIIPLVTVKESDGKLRRLSREEIESHSSPVRVATNGFGMVLIKRRVIEGMDYPYCQGVPMSEEETPDGISGEDYYFCIKAMEKEFQVWLDPTEVAMHLGIKPYGIWDVPLKPKPKPESNLIRLVPA